MSVIKKLASQTAIYGLSSIVARFFNYLLTPLYTSKEVFTPDQYGIISEMYAYVAFLVVFLTYGMETAFFRFSSRDEFKSDKVYSTVLISLLSSTGIFILTAWIFCQPIADFLLYPDHKEYVIWFAIIVGLDAVSSIPLARLRKEHKAVRFAMINLINIIVNIGLNLFFLAYCMQKYKAGEHNFLVDTFYDPGIGVGYVFISNLISSIVKFILLTPQMEKIINGFNPAYWKKMMVYALPLLIVGLAGMINETIDRVMLKRMLYNDYGEVKTNAIVGIYSGVYKISIIITLFIQAFRYASEPFFFAEEKNANAPRTYARVMNYFVMVCAIIFLFVMLFIDAIKYFTPNPEYWQALHIVPVLLMANVFLGIYYNQAIWYRLTGKTMYGAYISLGGAILTVVINYIFIPYYTYEASAWATFICYGSMMLASHYFGQKYYPVPYNIGKIILYMLFSFGLYLISTQLYLEGAIKYIVNAIILFGFIGFIYFNEFKRKRVNPY